MNKVLMMGRITRDLELKATPNGKSVCAFSIAVDRKFKSADGEKVTDFFNVVTWGKTAETVTRYFGKGRMILVEGEMQTRKYTDKNGNPATWYEINAENIYFTGEKRADDAQTRSNAPETRGNTQTGNYPPSVQNALTDAQSAADDDYPF
ncbi:MAG: single-stranded DNA-binding protein [Lachnospiraceae bacterium]|nr:single-stranded DNA-binding protein [Ruminococcus sp.]MCM1277079.1 single-stranded DNA-binding protein [Lachnospiraceae bacterium]